jgi:hypothetical protein
MSIRFQHMVLLVLCAVLSAACQERVAAPAQEGLQSHQLNPNPTWVEGQLVTPDPMVAQWIGPEGGTLVLTGRGLDGKLAAHTLTVPARAVAQRLLFTMELTSTTHLEVELNAFLVAPDGTTTTEVGQHGFKRPVTLSLSYAGATNVVSPSALNIVWIEDGKAREKVRKVRDDSSKQWVAGELNHFSRYRMAAN